MLETKRQSLGRVNHLVTLVVLRFDTVFTEDHTPGDKTAPWDTAPSMKGKPKVRIGPDGPDAFLAFLRSKYWSQ